MLRNVLFVLCFISTSLFATIKEIAHFCELAAHVTLETSLVLVDIDDTLIAPVQMLGSDTWFEYRFKKYQENGIDAANALEKSLAEWEAIRHLSQMELIEPEIPEMITSLQKNGVPVMGLTIQGLALATRTVLQLREHQIDLSLTSPHKEDRCLSLQGHTLLYRQGILFTSGKPKGESLFEFCKKIGKLPKQIVVIDDKLSHLQSLEKEAMKWGIEFTGLRYAFSDKRKKGFSSTIADYQLAHSTLIHLLSDQEAKEALQE